MEISPKSPKRKVSRFWVGGMTNEYKNYRNVGDKVPYHLWWYALAVQA